jgi:hypothetical protein
MSIDAHRHDGEQTFSSLATASVFLSPCIFVWTGHAVQAGCDDMETLISRICIRPLEAECFAPGHHGYPRASDLIRDKALEGRKYIKITDATVRPFLHLLNRTRRSRQESHGFHRRRR